MIIDSGVVTGSLIVSGSSTVAGNSFLQGNVQITGSLSVTGPISGAITGSVTSASYATFAENAGLLNNLVSSSFVGTASFNTFSGSIVGRVVSLESWSSSLDAQYATDASVSASITVLSSSVQISQAALSSSYTITSGSYATASGSLSTRTTNLESTASTLTTASSSFATVSQSYASASGSLSTRVTTIETSYATTGSNTFTGNNVFGNITGSNAKFNTASIEYLSVIYQTSSVVYSSGSNQFGDAAGDVQTLFGTVDVKTGPVLVTGSLNVSGGITGSLNGSNLVAASVANAKLTNSSVTVTAGSGLSGGGAVALGSSVSLANAGVTSNIAGTGVLVSGATGAVTISIGQAVDISSAVRFSSILTTGTISGSLINSSGDVVAFNTSDRTLKDNLVVIENPLSIITQITGYTFNWNDKQIVYEVGSADIGVVAQEVEIVLPQITSTSGYGFKAVKYDRLIPVLIEGVKAQQVQITAQQEQINELKELVNTLLNK